MPEFFHDRKLYYTPIEFALSHIGGTWKMPILWRLQESVQRFNELKKDIPHITDKMLTSQLRELEAKGMINRKVYAVVPPKVEYSLTDKGMQAIPVIETIMKFGYELIKEEGIEFPSKQHKNDDIPS
ncbi:helix-turn-helix domain-containing protein [Muricauda sp. 334s03]|uniref:Helix-turn-helix domain-containing protein n=1 Tax=Flagellimonas yonaguniensis TaxID=3031325 RepID=A0ABT5XWR1_9FLAO|nr:helix-turn-helix domain-containing protein [[Muricauda] yonaguniensis]MDF0715628.1 helix-turn-helix domain-containing protein [[Muricauda] yonaguniensis]